MLLPEVLLRAVSASGGGRVVLVVGAGTSMEVPTGLLSGAAYSADAVRQMVLDGVLHDGECTDPSDLSVVADVVYAKAGNQLPLTNRLPRGKWRTATPNRGHLLAAALLVEGALKCIVTLNYDLALQHALGQLGTPDEVSIVSGPHDHGAMGARPLIYLHRSAECDPSTWVLRKSDLDDAWRDSWEGVIASGALTAPMILFAGLGSPAAVLTESVRRIADSTTSQYVLADPHPDNAFAQALNGSLSEIVSVGWIDLMTSLGNRLAAEHVNSLRSAAYDDLPASGLDEADVDPAIDALGSFSLLDLGSLRAAWLLHPCPSYFKFEQALLVCLADLVRLVSRIRKHLNAALVFMADGTVVLSSDGSMDLTFSCVQGLGVKTWTSVQSLLDRRDTASAGRATRVVVTSGLRPASTPEDLLRDADPNDLLRGADAYVRLDADEIGNLLRGSSVDLIGRLAS